MPSPEQCIEQCRTWVETFIQAHNVCPFAGRVIAEGQLTYHCLQSTDVADCLTEVLLMIRDMQQNQAPETSLVILPAWQDDYDGFLALCDVARVMLADYSLDTEFQFASFHPAYLFAEEPAESASHYTNRSPWPILHVLRQSSISEALAHYPDPEGIPGRNIKLMQKLGKTALAAQLQAISESNS